MAAYLFTLNQNNKAIEDMERLVVTGKNPAQARAALVAELFGDPETMNTDDLVSEISEGTRMVKQPGPGAPVEQPDE